MNLQKTIFFTLLLLLSSLACSAQTKGKITQTSTKATATAIKSSPAFAEILLRKTERTAELEELLIEYTEEFPKVKQLRFELNLLNKEMDRILAVNPSDASKLTLALGKLMLRKIEFEIEYANLQKQYNDDRPDVKQAKRKVEIFEAAIIEILQ
ncbi:MAG: hypothetical protein ACR2MG_18315 [Pyrinomonadaceae bacterium]